MLKPKDVSGRLHVSVKTLQRWDNEGILVAHHTPTNRRYETADQMQAFCHPASGLKRVQFAYARVSDVGPKDDLSNPMSCLSDDAHRKGIILAHVMTDMSSGLNDKKKMAGDDDVNRIQNGN